MKTVVIRGAVMVKQDLFDFKYIEDQVSAIKQSMENVENTDNEKDVADLLEEQLDMLRKINATLENIQQNNNTKKGWFNFKN